MGGDFLSSIGADVFVALVGGDFLPSIGADVFVALVGGDFTSSFDWLFAGLVDLEVCGLGSTS